MISTEISQIKPTTPTTQSSFYQRKLLKLAVQKKNKAMIKIHQIHKPLQAQTTYLQIVLFF